MATTRIKDISSTVTSLASDDYIAVDGATNGTRKMVRSSIYTDVAAAFTGAPTTYDICPLNSGTNKIDATYLPTSGDTPKGEWNASSNSPALADGSGVAGDYYDVTTAGSQDLGSGSITFTVGDVVKYNGSTWYKIDSVANFLDGYSTAATSRSALEVNSIDEDAQANALKTTAPALYFDGSSSVVTVADDDKLSFTDGTDDLPFSISAWVNMEDATNFVVASKFTAVSGGEWMLNCEGDDLRLYLQTSSGNSVKRLSASAITSYEGEWVHLTATYAGTSGGVFSSAGDGITLYINGQPVAMDAAVEAGTYAGMANGTQAVRIGNQQSVFSKGSIRDVKIFNRELTADEVAELARGNDLGFADEWGGANGGLDTSNFSSGTDEYSAAQGTVTGNEGSIGGVDDWLKLTLNTSTAIHQILSPQVMPAGARVRVEFDCYIPETNSHVDGVKANLSSTITSEVIATHEGAATDTVFRVSGEGIATGNQRVYITALDGANSTVSDAGGDDWIAVKNVKITQIGTLADFRAEQYDTNTGKLYDLSDNAFVGAGTSMSLAGREVPVYSTGTWTPSITFGGGSTGITYSAQEGVYTRIGNTCFVTGVVTLSDVGSSTGTARLASLPFINHNMTATSYGSSSVVAFNMTGLTSVINLLNEDNQPNAILYDSGATGATAVTEANFTATSSVRFSMTYQIQ